MKIFDYPDLISDDESSFLIAADWLEEQNRNYEAECLRQGHVFSVWLYFLSVNFNYLLDYSHGVGHGYGYGAGDGHGYGDGTGYGSSYSAGDGFNGHFLMFFASISQGILKS
jgi:hypothetical protein